MPENLEKTCATCMHRKAVSENEMNAVQKKVYKGKILMCTNQSSVFYNGLVKHNWTCEDYEANF